MIVVYICMVDGRGVKCCIYWYGRWEGCEMLYIFVWMMLGLSNLVYIYMVDGRSVKCCYIFVWTVVEL